MKALKYRWRHKDRRWRSLRIREAARKMEALQKHKAPGRRAGGKLRVCLTAMVCFELAVGTGQVLSGRGADIRFLRREESCFVEWVEPGTDRNGSQDIYGVRINPESLELQLYHRSLETVP